MSAIAAIQMTSGPDVAANLEQARPLLEDAARRGAQLAVLPENFSFLGLRDTDKREVAEADGSGPVQDFLSATAKRLNIWIVAGTTPIKRALARQAPRWEPSPAPVRRRRPMAPPALVFAPQPEPAPLRPGPARLRPTTAA